MYNVQVNELYKVVDTHTRESKQGKQPNYLSASRNDIQIMPITLYIRTHMNKLI